MARKGNSLKVTKATKPAKKSMAAKRANDDNDELTRRRGGGKPWTSEEQTVYLGARIDDFERARQTHKKIGLQTFWRKTLQDYLKEWPLDEGLSDKDRDTQIDLLTERVKVWFNNHCRSTAAKSRGKLKAIIDFSDKKKRRRSMVHTYSSHFGDDKIAPIIVERWRKHKDYAGSDKIPISFRNELTEEVFKDETDEMKEEVARLREEDAEECDAAEYQYLLEEDGLDDEEIERREKIIELQKNIDVLPNTIVAILEQVRERTGFMGVCTFFGSEPKAGGSIATYSASVGETPVGCTIMEYYDGFEMKLEDDAAQFGSEVISPSERAELCMPGTEDQMNYVVPGRSRSDSRQSSVVASRNKSAKLDLRKQASLNTASRSTSWVLSEGSQHRKRQANDNEEGEGDPQDETPLHGKLPDDNDDHPASDDDNDKAVGGDEIDGNNEGEEDDEELQDLLASTGMMPTWLVSAIRYLYQPNANWIECIRSFVKLKEVLGFPSGKGVPYRLSALLGPSALTQFVNDHRSKEPTIEDPDIFADEVYLWWISLQPPSRRIDREDSPSSSRSLTCLASEVPNDETWDDLRKGSINGMFGMMCCLGWWIQLDSGRLDNDFIDLVLDVSWVLDVMALMPEAALSAARKRKADEDTTSPRKKARLQSTSPRKKARLQPSRSQPPRSQPPRSQPPRSQPPRSRTSHSQPSHSRA